MKPTLFSPSSVFWRVNRELTSVLAGPRAVLMQIAHPLVAQGVADHSRYRDARFGRLYRTAAAGAIITFCSEDFARKAVAVINRKHQKVHGVLRESTGVFPAGTPYNANDPALKLWVACTITDSTLLAYETFVAPLSRSEREQYYRESLAGAWLFGIPEDIMPPTYGDFLGYMQAMLSGKEIQVSDTARDIARALFSNSIGGAALYAGSFAGIGMLPERLRQEFELPWSPRRSAWLNGAARLHRSVRRHVPSVLCSSPVATVAQWVF